MKPLKNIGASVHHRLKNASKDSGRSFNDLAQYYALERWLYRMSKSRHANLFVLKGALMLVAWRAPILRATRDIDLLARTKNDLDNIKTIIAEICQEQVPDDGLWFDPESVTTERIAEDADYQGVRAQFRGQLATTRLAMQIDLGFSDVVDACARGDQLSDDSGLSGTGAAVLQSGNGHCREIRSHGFTRAAQ